MRIIGTNIPDNKRVEIGLMYFYGIGRALSNVILGKTHIDKNKRVKDLSVQEVNSIKDYIEKHYKVEGELRQIIKQNVNRLKELQAYRGVRHMRHLPVRGQRTKTNSRTVRGNVRKTMGSGRRKLDKK